MVHQHQVQCDTQTPVCPPSSQLFSTVTGPSVTKCCAVTPVLEHYPQHIYDLNEPISFLLSINNWTATEGAFSTAIWRGTGVAEFKMVCQPGSSCSCCWGGCRSVALLYSKAWEAFFGICVWPNPLNLFWAVHYRQRSQPFSTDPHLHLIHAYRDASDYYQQQVRAQCCAPTEGNTLQAPVKSGTTPITVSQQVRIGAFRHALWLFTCN